MLLTDRFIYLHMPKTAGTWAQHHLHEALGGRFLFPESHVFARDIPWSDLAKRTVIGTIRDPWSWYLSWYQFTRASKWWRDNYLAVFGDPDDFHAALYGMTHPDPRVAPVTKKIPYDHLQFIRERVGLYSHLFWNTFAVSERLVLDVLIDTAHIRHGLLEATGLDFTDTTKFPPQNVKEDRPHTILNPEEVWTEERVQWVRGADRSLIGSLGYTEPGKPLSTMKVPLPSK